jgi:hypothetical protein
MGMVLLGMGGITLAALAFQFVCFLNSSKEKRE